MDLPIRLVVGLGNPGPRYARTRHNAGQRVVEEFAEQLGVRRFANKYAGRYAEVSGPNGHLALLIPTTYMNLSGQAVGPAVGALKLVPQQVLVVHDDLDLPFGIVRGKAGGGHGGHNGLRSINEGLGSPEYPRVRLGIDRPPPQFRGDQADWVLIGFNEPAAAVTAMITRGREMVEAAVADGIGGAIARFHASEPGARARQRRERRDAELAPNETTEPDAPSAPKPL